MDSQQNATTPDLASVLRTLAAIGPAQISSAHNNVAPQPRTYQTQFSVSGTASPPQILNKYSSSPQHLFQDPTGITDWKTGLKHVMNVVARSEDIMKDIKRMIKTQHEHEVQWWAGRKALVEKQEARVEGQKHLDSVLKAVGAGEVNATTKTGPEAAAEELRTYDLKVYKAQRQMIKEMSVKFKTLKVPFFETRRELVTMKGKENTAGKVSEEELLQLQRKVLELLQDLCQDD